MKITMCACSLRNLRILLCGVCMLLFFHVLLNYFFYGTENTLNLSRLSLRKAYKHRGVFNKSDSAGMQSVNTMFTAATDSVSSERQLSDFGLLNVNASNDEVLPPCKMPFNEEDQTDSRFTPNLTLESLDVVDDQLGKLLEPGGGFKPKDCVAQHHVAIVVPFRDRYAHLSIFLRNIHPFLMKQHIAYKIFVVEQTNGKPFNRAALMNIGFLEALKIYPWDCFIFHDVDLLPLDNRNLYNCPRQPRHMSVAIDVLDYKLPYRSIFGGVSAMTREHFLAVNGFSNSYFGWGGEDDDMSNRLKHANLFIARYPINIARYTMLKHPKEKANPKRYENLVNGISKIEMDGLNSIKYEIYSYKQYPTFSWFYAELKISEQKS